MSTVFLDRDGVINENRPGYIKNWQEFHFLPGARESIARLSKAGHRIIVCTNQAGVASGELPLAHLDEIHWCMCKEVEAAGGKIERIYYCPHGKYEGCACRKPQPGLLQRALRELILSQEDALFVGDSISDVQAAIAAGVRPVMVLTGRGKDQLREHGNEVSIPFLVLPHLSAVTDAILHGLFSHAEPVAR